MNNSFLITLLSFFLITLAAQHVGSIISHFRLPKISGFLVTGLLASPFILGIVSKNGIIQLRFLEQIALAFIAFAAGSEIYLPELKGRLRSISWTTGGLISTSLVIGITAVYFITPYMPFVQSEGNDNTLRIAVALLAAIIMIARSPSVAIAVINELRAKGPFTQTALGVTIISDVAVIILFAVGVNIAQALFTGVGMSFSLIFLLLFEILLSVGIGYILGRILAWVLSKNIPQYLKTAFILTLGLLVYIDSAGIREYTHDHFAYEIFLEPLLICLVASFFVNNFSQYRREFAQILHDSSSWIYVGFFTLVGAGLKLDILALVWPIALGLFFIRIISILIGSFIGGTIAGDPMNHNRHKWMVFVTQAGVALGLAAEISVEFPGWGEGFATTIIAAVVLNEIFGPVLFKFAINRVGEAHPRAAGGEFDGVQDTVIFGLEDQSLHLARLLMRRGWQVKLATRSTALSNNTDVRIHKIPNISKDSFRQLDVQNADAIVALLSDEENYQICELIYEHFGIDTMIVRLNNRENFDDFHRLGVKIIDPSTAMVNMLEHFVISPSATSMLLGMEPEHEVMDIEVTDPSLDGVMLRDLRLPLDILILTIHRRGDSIVSHGYTQLKLGDRVTIVGSQESLKEMVLRFNH